MIDYNCKIKKVFICSVCGRSEGGETFRVGGRAYDTDDIKRFLDTAIANNTTSFPIGWASFADGNKCQHCKHGTTKRTR